MGSQAPLGKQDLFKTPGAELPGYVREIARALMRNGKSKSQAIQMAIGTVKNWAEGKGGVNADTRAKAAKAVAEWEAAKAKARATPNRSDHSNEAGEQDTLDFGNFLARSGVPVLLARPADDSGGKKKPPTPPKKKPGQTANKEGLPKGAVGYKHGWIPVDSSGKAVGPAQKPDWLKNAEAKHKAAGGRSVDAIENEKFKNEMDARKRKAEAPAKKAAAEAKRKKREAETAANKKKAAATKAANEAKRKTAAKERANTAAQRNRDALVSKAYRQALADQKAGRALSDTQKRVVASVQAKQAKESNALRKVDVKGADGSKAKLTPAKKATAKKAAAPVKKTATAAKGAVTTNTTTKAPAHVKIGTGGGSKVKSKSFKARDRRTKTGTKKYRVSSLANKPEEHHGVNVLDFAGGHPKGQLAFRYKHNWILINPAIPSRGHMGGAIARQHGHKSGGVTHGHFQAAPSGKGKVFVPDRHGGENNPAKLKAAHTPAVVNGKINYSKPDKSKFKLAATEKDTGGSALHPSTPSAEKVSAASKAANEASVKAQSSKSLHDAQVAAKKHADAFVQAKKAGDTQKAESHKSNAQAWAKKAGQIKQAEKATADAKKKYETEQKAKAAEEKAKAEKAKLEAEKAAAEKKAKEVVEKAHDDYGEAFNAKDHEKALKAALHLQQVDPGGNHGPKVAHEQKEIAKAEAKAKHEKEQAEKAKAAAPATPAPGKFTKAEGQVILFDGEGNKKTQMVTGMATPSGKLLVHKTTSGNGYDVTGPSGLKLPGGPFKTQKEAKAYALWAEKNGPDKFTKDAFDKWKADNPAAVVKFQAGVNKQEWNADLAKVEAKKPSAPEPKPAAMGLGDAVGETMDEIGAKAPGLAAWDDYLHASALYKKNPSSANLKAMSAAAADLKKKSGATNADLQAANKKLYAKLGLGGAPSAPAAPKVAEKKFSAEDFKISLPGPGMFKDGNAINAAIKSMGEADAKGASGAEIDARLKAIDNAKAAFKAKHGVEFTPTKVEGNLPGATPPAAPFVPQTGGHISNHPFFSDAKAAGYSPVDNHVSANNGWKPSDVPGLKSSKGAYTYSGGSYTAINAHLRPNTKGGTPGDPKAGKWAGTIAQMDKEFDAVPGLDKPIVTIRKMDNEGPFNSAPPYMGAGGVFVDDGYSSTAKDPAVWAGSVHMEVRIPAGTKVLDLNHTVGSQHSSEQEILLNRGTKYKVISDGPGHTAGVRKIVVEVVQ